MALPTMTAIRSFKNEDKSFEDMRLCRNQVSVHLRKERREGLHFKLRCIEPEFEEQQQQDLSLSFATLLEVVVGQSPQDCLSAMKSIRKKVTELEAYRSDYEAFKGPLLKVLCSATRYSQQPNLQYEAAWALVNIAFGTKEDVVDLVRNGAMDAFAFLLGSPLNKLREIAVWGIGNLIGGSQEFRDLALKYHIVELIWKVIILQTTAECHSKIAWCMISLCKNIPKQISQETLKCIVDILLFLLKNSTDNEVLENSATAILFVLESLSGFKDLFVLAGFIPLLTSLLSYKHNTTLLTTIMRIFGTLASGDDKQTQSILDNGVFKYIPGILMDPSPRLRREALWLLVNVAAGTPAQKQHIIQHGLVPIIVDHLRRSNEYPNQREASWVVHNLLAQGGYAMVQHLVVVGVVPVFIDLLREDDYHLVVLTLNSLISMFKALDPIGVMGLCMVIAQLRGPDVIERLQYNSNETISELATNLNENYLSTAGPKGGSCYLSPTL